MKIVVTQPQLSQDDHAANLDAIGQVTATIRSRPVRPDFLLLPECFFRQDDLQAYEQFIREIAQTTGACVIGGSVHARTPPDDDTLYNTGLICAPDGHLLACYTKRHPYGREQALGVMEGEGLCEFSWNGMRCAVLICADFWDSRLVSGLSVPPDLLCVVAASVSQEHGPAAARNLWYSLAIARAFEFTSVIAISDWAVGPVDAERSTCGVAGVANPTDLSGRFQPIADAATWQAFTFDLEKLCAFRTARKERGFYFDQ